MWANHPVYTRYRARIPRVKPRLLADTRNPSPLTRARFASFLAAFSCLRYKKTLEPVLKNV